MRDPHPRTAIATAAAGIPSRSAAPRLAVASGVALLALLVAAATNGASRSDLGAETLKAAARIILAAPARSAPTDADPAGARGS